MSDVGAAIAEFALEVDGADGFALCFGASCARVAKPVAPAIVAAKAAISACLLNVESVIFPRNGILGDCMKL